MNWISNYVRPKINSLFSRRELPENLWRKCDECGTMLFHRELQEALHVCPNCQHHMLITPRERFEALFDGGLFVEVDVPAPIVDPLAFRDEKRYADRIRDARRKTGEHEAMLVGEGEIGGLATVCAAQDFSFMGGSMGMGVGNAIVAISNGLFVPLCIAGGSSFICYQHPSPNTRLSLRSQPAEWSSNESVLGALALSLAALVLSTFVAVAFYVPKLQTLEAVENMISPFRPEDYFWAIAILLWDLGPHLVVVDFFGAPYGRIWAQYGAASHMVTMLCWAAAAAGTHGVCAPHMSGAGAWQMCHPPRRACARTARGAPRPASIDRCCAPVGAPWRRVGAPACV